jgi:hypothetical protein
MHLMHDDNGRRGGPTAIHAMRRVESRSDLIVQRRTVGFSIRVWVSSFPSMRMWQQGAQRLEGHFSACTFLALSQKNLA